MLSLTLRQTAALILIFALTSVGLIILDQQNRLDTVKASADQIVRPLATTFNEAGRTLRGIRPGGDTALSTQLEAVTEERDRLLAENARLKQLEQEVAQLRDQLGFKTAHPELRLVSANVIGRDPDGTEQYLVIDRGSNDGILTGMAVVSPNFFVGQITEVEPTRSRVTLATDASFQVAAMLQASGAEGIVYGRHQYGGWMEMRYLDPHLDVPEGALVVTSGKTARVPEALVIGKVSRIDRDLQADTLTLGVTPLVDPGTLQSVTVILGSETE